jgi:DNA-binding NarL/FixJ family response regulator
MHSSIHIFESCNKVATVNEALLADATNVQHSLGNPYPCLATLDVVGGKSKCPSGKRGNMGNLEISTRIRVIVADDHPAMRRGLTVIIEAEPQMHVVADAGCFQALSHLLAVHEVHVLILDLIGMGATPDVYIRKIKQTYPHLGIVIFSGEVDFVSEMLEAGAVAYVAKSELENDYLLLAIRAAKAGQHFLSPRVQEYIDCCAIGFEKYRLVPQEVRILKLLAQGMDTRPVANYLGISYKTVHNYVSKIRDKTGCRTRTQMVSWYQTIYGVMGG